MALLKKGSNYYTFRSFRKYVRGNFSKKIVVEHWAFTHFRFRITLFILNLSLRYCHFKTNVFYLLP